MYINIIRTIYEYKNQKNERLLAEFSSFEEIKIFSEINDVERVVWPFRGLFFSLSSSFLTKFKKHTRGNTTEICEFYKYPGIDIATFRNLRVNQLISRN